MLYKKLVRPALFRMEPEHAHHMAFRALRLLHNYDFLAGPVRSFLSYDHPMLVTELLGLHFSNPVGLAAGFDKNIEVPNSFYALGFGHVEVGAVTRYAQPGNPRPRLFRLEQDAALINRMGFNNDGADVIARRAARIRHKRIPVGINIGRSKITENKDAATDYLYTFRKLFGFGDFFTINVSSPNTPGLRELQEKDALYSLIDAVQRANIVQAARFGTNPKPVLVKVSPDLAFSQLDDVLTIVKDKDVSGIIATNTTTSRSGVSPRGSQEGGLSGRPLRSRSTQFIRYIYERTQGKTPIIGVGGIFTAKDAYQKIKSGANLVQLYTSLIYEGPSVAKTINRGLVKLMKEDHIAHVSDAVGRDVK